MIKCPFYQHDLTSITPWISNYIHYKVWDEITYPFPNFNGATIEVWEWIHNFMLHFTEYVITYPCWDQSWTMLVKWAPGNILERGNFIHKYWLRPLICIIVNTNIINHYNSIMWDSEYLHQWLTTILFHVIDEAVSSACKYLIGDIVVSRTRWE